MRLRILIPCIAALLLSLFLGLGSAWLTVRSPTPIDAISIGPWQAWPRSGTDEADPYSEARAARTGEVPLGPGEGLSLLARTDSSGQPIDGACTYRVHGTTPPARLWTMTVENENGSPADGSSDLVHSIGSDAILRASDGSFSIALSSAPQSGNWLSTSGTGRIRLVFRLYDTTARVVTALTTLVMPDVERVHC
ncbi:hypothetical protein SAMN05216548_11319 [Faunimonas pinastri]|uniref:DUF1214 domain-containing protein n=1 Tax=Faunimonas pinastri TaxID=1855383 RepID=A0A1H9M9Y3_9HYPH|nr:DUF1214 domain-containing protein [Faunimonas pinastri]SER20267.1 hypothetical protein SAMN05216548_11319 [Faunimonas pinastri]